MKIAVIGTHSTGKTTLCHDIVAALRHVGRDAQVVNEVARGSPLPVNENTSFDAQYWVLATQIKHEIEYGTLHETIVCDRGVIDNFMYLLRRFPDKAALLSPLVLEHCKRYYLIIRTLIEKDAEKDSFRSVDQGFREEIDAMLGTFLETHGIPHVTITGNDKVAKIVSLIQEAP